MILPDANLLIYAHDRSSRDHISAKDWWQTALSGEESIGHPLGSGTRLYPYPDASPDLRSTLEYRASP